MKFNGPNQESFEVIEINQENCDLLKSSGSNELSLLWFSSDDNHMTIDSVPYVFDTNQIITFTEFHMIENLQVQNLKLLRFNKPFYCILDHDSEVGCKGVLYYGSSDLPVIYVPEEEIEVLEAVWKVLYMELESKDSLQLEMLQMMLKRILILCTRLFKSQIQYSKLEAQSVDIIREFNYLVETHFREMHHVVDYAGLLNKAPKTLSNLFKKLGNKTPLQFIQNRLLLEAHRLLKHSQKSISEIAYELGYNDLQSFSRFFKKQEGVSPLEYRDSG